MKGLGIRINMIYGVLLKSYAVKNSINRIRTENDCVCANYDSVYQFSRQDRRTGRVLEYD